jgi:hypothetical protein
LAGFEEEFICGKLHPIGIIYGLARLDAEKHVMGLGVFPVEVVTIVGRHKGYGEFMGEFFEDAVHSFLLRQVVRLELKVETLFVKDRGQFNRLLFCLFRAAMVDEIGNDPLQAGRQGDEATVKFPQKFHIHTGMVVKSLQMAKGDEAAQVFIAFIIHHQEDQVMGVGAPIRRRGSILTMVRGHVNLATQDGFNAHLRGLIEKLYRTK